MLELRRADLLDRNAAAFGDKQRKSQRCVAAFNVKVPAPPPLVGEGGALTARCSHESRFRPSFTFRDPSPPRASNTGLPVVPSARRNLMAARLTTPKPQEISSPRFLCEKLPSTTRPNPGTLNDGAPLYSSFSQDFVYRGHMPRGALELTLGLTQGGSSMGAGTPRGVFGSSAGSLQPPPSRALIR